MIYHFQETLNGTASWGNVYTSTAAFGPLALAIFHKEGFAVHEEIRNLTPGTNAVFRADHFVIKIFAPQESGFHTEQDYFTELSVMKFAIGQGISVPYVIAYGELEDKYLFRYIVMEYVEAGVSPEELLSFSIADKESFTNTLKAITESLHQPFDQLPQRLDLRQQPLRTERMRGLSLSLIEELSRRAENQLLLESDLVLVHGDITRDNVLLGSNGNVTLIDFADCLIAPSYYELPAIIFELFLCDKELVSAWIGDTDRERFLEMLIDGLSLHLFCGNILKDYLTRSGLPIDSVNSIEALKDLLRHQWFLN